MERPAPVAHALCLLLFAAACGGGGGAAPPQIFEQSFDFAVVRADVATTRNFPLTNPFPEQALLELVGSVEGAVAPLAGSLPAPVPALAAFQLPVVLTPGAPGPLSGGFRVRFRVAASGQQREIGLRFTAEVERALLRLLSSSVEFGNVRIGEKRSRTLGLKNDSAVTPVRVFDVTPLPASFRPLGPALPATLAGGATLTLTWEYEPAVPESHLLPIAIGHDAGADLAATVRAVADTWIDRVVVDFGAVPIVGGDSPWLEVTLSPHAVSLSLEGIGPPGIVLGINGFEGPAGKVYENATFTGAFLQFPMDEIFTATLPQSDDPAVQLVPGGGTYRFRLNLLSGAASSVNARAIVLNRPLGVAATGRLDLNLFLAPGLGLTPATAPSNATLQAVLAEIDRVLAHRDLRLGAIAYYAIPASYDFVATEAQFGDLCATSAAASENRLNVFLVREALGGSVLGIAARIAGPMRLGTRSSGVMVDYTFGTVANRAQVIAHEICHYLGLLHTTESDGSHDLISDTAECPATGTNAACPTPGGGYLMHWQFIAADPLLSPAQGRILLVHPHVGELASALARAPAPAPPGIPPPLPEGWCGCRGCKR